MAYIINHTYVHVHCHLVYMCTLHKQKLAFTNTKCHSYTCIQGIYDILTRQCSGHIQSVNLPLSCNDFVYFIQ